MNRFLAFAALLVLPAWLAAQDQTGSTKPAALKGWVKDLAELRARAQKEKKPILWIRVVGDLDGMI